MTLVTKDLGLVQAMYKGATAPTNTALVWFDTNVNLHKYYNTFTTTWVTFAASAATLAQVLLAGATTGGTNISVTSGDKVRYLSGAFTGDLEPAVLTGNRTWQLPNSSGVLALLSDITAVDLATVLSSGIVTGAYNISIDNSQYIHATNGGGRLNLRDGADGVVSLLSDGTTTNSYLTLRASGSSEWKSQNGRFELTGSRLSFFTAAVEKFQISQTSDDVYFFNTTAAKKIFVGIDVDTLLAIEAAGVVVPAGRKLSVGGAALGVETLYVGYTGGAGFGSVGIDKAAGTTSYFRFFSAGASAFEISLTAADTVYFNNQTTNSDTIFRAKPGGTPTDILSFIGLTGLITAHQNLSLQKELFIRGTTVVAAASISLSGFSNARLTAAGVVDVNEITGYTTDKVLFLRNEGPAVVTLKHNNIVSAGKLYLTGAADRALGANEGIILTYSSTQGAWINHGK